jgi:hypothetical protein
MVERISTQSDLKTYLGEREMAGRLREAISFCKNSLELQPQINDRNLKAEDRVNFERCLTENYLIRKGLDYFGKRDLIYVDLYGRDDLRAMRTSV